MTKSPISLLVITFIWFTTPTANAQSIKNEVQIFEGIYGIEKKQIITQVMNLSGKEANDFWTIYDSYEEKRKVLCEERLFLTHDYVVSFASLTNAKASEITSRSFKSDDALAKLHKQYYRKLKKVLSPLKAAQFIQAEDYLQTMVRIQIQSRIPFIGEIVTNVNNNNEN